MSLSLWVESTVNNQSHGLAGPSMFLVEFRESTSDLVSDVSKHCENLFFAPCRFRGIRKAELQAGLHMTGEGRAILIRLMADGDDVVKGILQKLTHSLRTTRTDIDPNLFHHLDCRGMDFGRGLGSCRMDLEI